MATTISSLLHQHSTNSVDGGMSTSASRKAWAESTLADFDAVFGPGQPDDTLRLQELAYPPNDRQWRVDTESDAKNWVSTRMRGKGLLHDFRGYAHKYECPQIFCFDGQTLLLLQFRAREPKDIAEADCAVDCWVIPRINRWGSTLRYALYRLLAACTRLPTPPGDFRTPRRRQKALLVALKNGVNPRGHSQHDYISREAYE
ncbi:hypothetical protein G6O67_007500 [Ophiocordyceps sinensis]|uniref:Uncharacterized protein n=1 Tax=Ophiocordyceps sinensis TaxID=72228 RepID=A0A8H4LVA6_9HYPO|nr:hypothetical protein G6O67_007500 [Ophiocordyceps sinensis]